MNMSPVYSFLYHLLLMLMLTMSCQAQDPTDKKIRISQNPIEIATPNTQEKESSPTMHADAPSVITRNILQDKNGIIWFATFEGIISYDGASFSNLTKGQPIRFFSVLEDRHGHLWFGSILSLIHI